MEICQFNKHGLFVGLVRMRERAVKTVPLPLKSSQYDVEIVNTIANITLVQTFINPQQKFLEVQYNFPVNPDACVYRFVAEFGNKRIEGIVKEKEAADKQYKDAIKNGKQAALGKIDPARGDILNLQVGNIAPNQTVKIEISYMQELSLSYNMFYEFHMKGTISPSFMNKIPREILKRSFKSQAAKAKGDYYWNFKISLKTSRKVNFHASNTHKIKRISQNDSQTELKFEMTSECIPNKDFTFTYATQDYYLPSYVLGRTDFSSTAMISFIPKFCEMGLDDAYQASLSGTSNEMDIESARGEYIFLLDRSGSMKGRRIEKAKQALILFIKSLPQDVYFNVISFGHGYRPLFKSSVRYADQEIKMAVREVKQMEADLGGTQIYAPLEYLFREKPIQGYPKQIFLLTDGAVTDTAHILNLIEDNNKYSRVHTIGIGNGASEELVTGCAKRGKGYHTFITDNQNPSSKIIKLLVNSLSPIITKMKLIYDKSVVQSIMPNPESLPFILKGQIVNFYVNFKGQIAQKTKIGFTYEDSLNKHSFGQELQIDPQSPSESFIDRMGNFKKIRAYEIALRSGTDLMEHIYTAKVVDKKTEIINLSIKSQILSEHTAFISVEKEVVDGKYEEVKSLGQIKVEVQNVKPIQYTEKKKEVIKKSLCISTSKIACDMPINMPMKEKSRTRSAVSSAIQIKQPRRKQEIKKQSLAIKQLEQKYECQEKQEICLRNQSEIGDLKMERPQTSVNMLKKKGKAPSGDRKQEIPLRLSIAEIIAFQLSDGSWKDERLVDKIYGDVKKVIHTESLAPVLVTYLVVKWIEKNFPQVQYTLVIKKGLNFIKKSGTSLEELAVQCEKIKI